MWIVFKNTKRCELPFKDKRCELYLRILKDMNLQTGTFETG